MKNFKKIVICLTIMGLYFTPVLAQRPTQRPNQGGGMGQQNPRPERPPIAQERPRVDRAATSMPAERMEKLESAKVAFLSQKVDLSPKEAEKFWPIYNEYQNEVKKLAKERLAEKRNAGEVSADQRINDQLETETKMLELKKKYTREFSKVISSEKVARLYDAEKQFRQELVKSLQERKKGQRE